MTVPDDLIIDIVDGFCRLSSGGKTVSLDIGGRYGVFRNGPVTWKDIVFHSLTPALWHLQPDAKLGKTGATITTDGWSRD